MSLASVGFLLVEASLLAVTDAAACEVQFTFVNAVTFAPFL